MVKTYIIPMNNTKSNHKLYSNEEYVSGTFYTIFTLFLETRLNCQRRFIFIREIQIQ